MTNRYIKKGFVAYVFYGERHALYPRPYITGANAFHGKVTFRIIDGEPRVVKDEMPPGAVRPAYLEVEK